MSRNLFRARTMIPIALLSLLMASAAAALSVTGAIPADDGQIYACYKIGRGDLRAVSTTDECDNHEAALQWNQVGEPGPTGPQGPAGPTHLFATGRFVDDNSLGVGRDWTTVATLEVPPAEYLVTANVWLVNDSFSYAQAYCSIYGTRVGTQVADTVLPNGLASQSLSAVGGPFPNGTLVLTCRDGLSGNLIVRQYNLIALQVGPSSGQTSTGSTAGATGAP